MCQARFCGVEGGAAADEPPSTAECGIVILFSPSRTVAYLPLICRLSARQANQLDDGNKVRNNNYSQLRIYPIRADFYPNRYGLPSSTAVRRSSDNRNPYLQESVH
jgi:hypothetical protein